MISFGIAQIVLILFLLCFLGEILLSLFLSLCGKFNALHQRVAYLKNKRKKFTDGIIPIEIHSEQVHNTRLVLDRYYEAVRIRNSF